MGSGRVAIYTRKECLYHSALNFLIEVEKYDI